MNNLGQKLRVLREQKGLLLRQVAAILEVDTALISKIERGERKASKQQVEKMARLLEVDRELLIALWLADKIETSIVEEPDAAYEAINIVRKNLKK
jgi:HTH-type transcriptional regulator, competence development regulator